jgi:transcriptional antiterminator NusG
MSETQHQDRPTTTDPATEEFADVTVRAEEGDEAASVALEEAGGPGTSSDEPAEEPVLEVEAEMEPSPEDDLTDVPTEEAAVLEADVEDALPEDVLEGKDEGPLVEEQPPATPGAEAVPTPQPVPAAAAKKAPASAPPAEEDAPPSLPFEGPGEWYVVHTYAGYENKVKANLHSRIGSMQMEDKIFDVVIPMEDVMEIKGGKKQVVQRKVFPGYLLVKMIYDNDSWYVVRNTPGVTGFVSSGTGTKPTPLSKREVEKILAVKEETQVKPTFRLEWEEGDVVRIIIGPFADFTGTIAEINVEQSKLKVLVNIFDRETPVELAFDQVAKV